MMSLRAFTRSAPRAFTRSFSVAARPASRLPTAFSRPTSLQTSLTKYQYSAFSTARVLREPAGESDLELAAKLDDEAGHEKNNTATDAPAEAVRAFLEIESNPWKVSDVAGEQEISLTRKFGNENIRATFTISDLQNLAEEDFNDLSEGEFGEHGANQPGQAVGVHPEDQVSPADREFDENPPAFPVRVSITIEKPGKGALLIQTSAQDGVFEIEDVYHFAKADLANAETAEKDWTRQSLYGGPVYANLDEDLQALFERYLEERGFDAELANFIPDYITVKEQKEYARWLGNLKGFVSA